MRILKEVAKMLAAVALLVAVWCESAGKFILRCMPGYRAPDPGALVEEYVDAAETVPTEPTVDQRMLNIQSIADALFRGEAPDPDLAAGLAPSTMQWLATLNADMLLAVVHARPEDLREHIKGSKTMRGLLLCDPGSVADFQAAVAQKARELELEYQCRHPGRPEPLLSIFGPMC